MVWLWFILFILACVLLYNWAQVIDRLKESNKQLRESYRDCDDRLARYQKENSETLFNYKRMEDKYECYSELMSKEEAIEKSGLTNKQWTSMIDIFKKKNIVISEGRGRGVKYKILNWWLQ